MTASTETDSDADSGTALNGGMAAANQPDTNSIPGADA